MTELEELISKYGDHDTEIKSLKKIYEAEKEQIKNIMLSQNDTEEVVGGYKVTCNKSERISIDENMVLDTLLKYEYKIPDGIIKTKQYVDMDVLENALYNESIDDDILTELAKARRVTEVVTLKCSKVKEKKGE